MDSTSDSLLAYKLTKVTVTPLKVEPIYLHNVLTYNFVDKTYCRSFFILLKNCNRWSLFVNSFAPKGGHIDPYNYLFIPTN